MIQFLTDNPTVLLMLTCCIWPAVCVGFGVFIGRYRPKFRVPFVIDAADEERREF